MTDVSEVTSSSDRDPAAISAPRSPAEIKLGDLEQALDGLRAQQAQLVAEAQELDPPGPLRGAGQPRGDDAAPRERWPGSAGLAQGSRDGACPRCSRRAGEAVRPRCRVRRPVPRPLAGDHARGGCCGSADFLLPQHARARRGLDLDGARPAADREPDAGRTRRPRSRASSSCQRLADRGTVEASEETAFQVLSGTAVTASRRASR